MDAIHFSEYAEKCCESLEKSGLHSDRILVSLCRLQNIVERFGMARSSYTQKQRARGLVFEFVYDTFRQTNDVDVSDFVRQWDRQLTQLWETIPEPERTSE